MQCASCGRAIAAFPGAEVRCSCGAAVRIPKGAEDGSGASRGGPYRAPAERPAAFPERPLPGGRRPHHVAQIPRCPRCEDAMLHGIDDATEGAAAVLECAACHGMFVAHSALEATLLHRRGLERSFHDELPFVEGEVRYLACPRCEERMTRRLFGVRSGLVVDVCSMHGIWFDRGEIDRAARVPDDAREAALPPGPVDVAAAEARRAQGAAEAKMVAEGLAGRLRTWDDGPPRDLFDVLIELFLG